MVVAALCCRRAMGPDEAPVAAQARTPSWLQVASLATHIRLFLVTLESPALSLFIESTSFCFSLSLHFSTTYLFLLVVPGYLSVWGFLRSGVRDAIPCSCIIVPEWGHLGHGLLSKACKVSGSCSYQDNFLTMPLAPICW